MDIGELKAKWEVTEPSTKRNVYIGAVVLVMVAMFMMAPKRNKSQVVEEVEKPETFSLADDGGQADISTLASENRTLKAQMAEYERQLQIGARERQNLRQTVGTLSKLGDNPEELSRLMDELNQMRLDMDAIKESAGRAESSRPTGGVQILRAEDSQGGSNTTTPNTGPLTDPFSNVGDQQGDSNPLSFDPLAKLKPRLANATGDDPSPSQGSSESRFGFMKDGDLPQARPRIQVERVVAASDAMEEESLSTGRVGQTVRDEITERIERKRPIPTPVLPAATMFKGTLLNGMDAPTGQTSASQPHPVSIRVSSLAFLPNRFTTDVKDCFVLAGGFGDIASHRVHLRTERLACVKKDGSIVDVELEGYISGEDGKVGVRGTLVHRTGALLANAMLAGLGSGFSEALQPRQINSVQTGAGGGGIDFQAPPTGEVLEIGAYRGAAEAMGNLSQYYLERAQEIFPIIELDALRSVTIHVTKPVKLIAKEPGEWDEPAQQVSRR